MQYLHLCAQHDSQNINFKRQLKGQRVELVNLHLCDGFIIHIYI